MVVIYGWMGVPLCLQEISVSSESIIGLLELLLVVVMYGWMVVLLSYYSSLSNSLDIYIANNGTLIKKDSV